MDREAWHAVVYGVAGSQTWLSDWIELNYVVLEKILVGTLDSQEIKPVNPKGNQPWMFNGRIDAEAPIIWPPDVKSWLIGRDPDAKEDWRHERMGRTEDEMVWWHH